MILLVMTDGRAEYIEQTVSSALDNIVGDSMRIVVNDDSANKNYNKFLKNLFSKYPFETFITDSVENKSGFGGAIQNAWNFIKNIQDDFIFHLEDDFVFNRTIEINKMKFILNNHSNVQQVALRRQPWNEVEALHGGIVESNLDAFIEKRHFNISWLEHRLFFTTNPSLYRKSLCSIGWPQVERSEGIFSIDLFRNPRAVSSYFGSLKSGEWVKHIGYNRTGHGY